VAPGRRLLPVPPGPGGGSVDVWAIHLLTAAQTRLESFSLPHNRPVLRGGGGPWSRSGHAPSFAVRFSVQEVSA
jgi:hypothetical protein